MPLDSVTLKVLNYDWDAREVWIREIVRERLAIHPPPRPDDAIVASYFFVLRTMRLESAVAEIAYQATSGIKHPPAGSLLEACTAREKRGHSESAGINRHGVADERAAQERSSKPS
ncbi:MAG: hypothetical protein ACLQNE_24595 [Thermoguttaceae bacterium]